MAWLDRAQQELGSLEDDVAAMQLKEAGLRAAAVARDPSLEALRIVLAQRDRQARGVPCGNTGAVLPWCA